MPSLRFNHERQRGPRPGTTVLYMLRSSHVQYFGPLGPNHVNLMTMCPVLFWFCSWRRRFWGSWRGVLVLLPDVEGSKDPGEEFWFCFLTWKVLGLLARSSGSASWQGRFWGSWRGVLVLLSGKEGSGAPGEEFWFCSWRRSSGSSS